jgi:branched-chain amino acid transport system substrate-binding protein
VLLVAAVAVMQGCAFFTGTKPGNTTGSGTIKVGLVGSFSGSNAGNGDTILNAANMALAKINATGVLGGQKIAIINGDDKSDPATAATVAGQLIDQGAVALIGPNSSGVAKEMLEKTAKPRGVAMITPSATSPDFSDATKIDAGGFFFRTVPSDALQGKVLAAKASTLGYKSLAVIHVDNPYGTGLTNVLTASFKAKGGTVLDLKYPEIPDPQAQAAYDYASLVKQALAANPSAIVFAGYPSEGSIVINEWLRTDQKRDLPWMFTDATDRQDFVDNIKDKGAVENKFGTAPLTDPKFVELYTAQYKADPGFDGGAAYDALALVALAIENGKDATAKGIREHLRGVSGPAGTVFQAGDLDKALAAARAGTPINYEGWSGPVDLDEHGDVTSGKYVIWNIKGGKVANTTEVLSP